MKTRNFFVQKIFRPNIFPTSHRATPYAETVLRAAQRLRSTGRSPLVFQNNIAAFNFNFNELDNASNNVGRWLCNTAVFQFSSRILATHESETSSYALICMQRMSNVCEKMDMCIYKLYCDLGLYLDHSHVHFAIFSMSLLITFSRTHISSIKNIKI